MNKLERWLPFKFFRKDKSEPKPSENGRDLAPTVHSPPARQHALASSPFSLLSPSMNQLMQSMFDDPFFRDPFARFAEMDRWFGDFSPARFVPSVEVADEPKALRVTAELPGMSKSDITLQVEDDMLVISGEKRNAAERSQDGVFRTERYYGHFQRAIPLPHDVDSSKAEADFREGVLTVRVPKIPEAKERGRSIPISG